MQEAAAVLRCIEHLGRSELLQKTMKIGTQRVGRAGQDQRHSAVTKQPCALNRALPGLDRSFGIRQQTEHFGGVTQPHQPNQITRSLDCGAALADESGLLDVQSQLLNGKRQCLCGHFGAVLVPVRVGAVIDLASDSGVAQGLQKIDDSDTLLLQRVKGIIVTGGVVIRVASARQLVCI